MTVAASAVWRVRPGGNNLNGGGYDGTSYPGGTDYSQADAAKASGVNLTVDATTNTNVAPDGYTPVAADVGNAIQIQAATGWTAGVYFITALASGKWVLDRSPAAVGTAGAAWKLGGGWADFWTNTTSAKAWIVPGNTVYILGSGVPNPASYTIDYNISGGFTSVSGNPTSGKVCYAADPGTPSYLSGGRPLVSVNSNNALWYTSSCVKLFRLSFIASVNLSGVFNSLLNSIVQECFFDQYGYDAGVVSGSCSLQMVGCEVTSSVAKRGTNNNAIVVATYFSAIGCNFHDCLGPVISFSSYTLILIGNIFAKNGGTALKLTTQATGIMIVVMNNTIDGNTGDGIEFTAPANLMQSATIMNNIISNHSATGLAVDSGTAAANELLRPLIDYNTFYNNTQHVSGISQGAHDTILAQSPYVNSGTENYALA